MPQYDYDLFTIGAGSGGVAASRRAASYGARVAICESGRVGGTCVLRGCVPKKLLTYAAHYRDDFEDAAGYGYTVAPPAFDWSTLMRNKGRELDRLNRIYERMLRDAGVEIIYGKARLVDPHTVAVADRNYTAAQILIATGGWPVLPQIPGIEHAITSNEALDLLPDLPRRVAIVGGGYIGVEFAGIFRGLGSQVTMIMRGDGVLRGFDEDIRAHLSQELERRGIKLLSETVVHSIAREPPEAGAAGGEAAGTLSLLTEQAETIEADVAMYATGRAPNTAGMGLEEAGVRLGPGGAVQVDEASRTSVPSVYAIGDCTDRLNLTPVAIAEGRALAETLFNNNPMVVRHRGVPTAVFSQPPVGTVGLCESDARAQYGEVDVFITSFRPIRHSLSGRGEHTMMKLVVDRRTDVVLGCHMVGPDAPEIIQGLAIALQCGATKAQFSATIGIHPSAAEEFVTMRTKRPDHGPNSR